MGWLGSIALGCALICLGSAVWEPKMHLGRPKFGLKVAHTPEFTESGSDRFGFGPMQGMFYQKLDHFNTSDTRQFSQRYFANMNFHTGGNVVFLNLGGEGPESMSWVQDIQLPWLQWAQQNGAAVFNLEHRFYGESLPFSSQSVANLKYLSSRQAIEDVAEFINQMNAKYNFTAPRWITFGGSYSGALSLWVREKHPELVAGAVGSSGPVQATFDFYKYLKVVEDSIRSYSNPCADNIKAGFMDMQQKMNSVQGRANLTNVFTLQPPLQSLGLNYNDIQNFYSTIFGNFQGAVQYSGDNAGSYKNGYSIPDVCALMLMNETPLQNLATVNTYMATFGGGTFTGTPNNYTDMIAYLKVENFTSTSIPGFDSGARSWTWQTCTEFGYFQSTDGNNNGIFGPVTPNNLYINMCRDVFGSQFTADFISSSVDFTNKYYGGADGYTGTNVVIPNGSLDPWHALGKYTSTDPTVVFYLISGTAHCADMYPARAQDQPGLAVVRKLIQQNINNWVTAPYSSRTLNATQPWTRPPTQYVQKLSRAKRSVPEVKTVEHNAVPSDIARFRKMHLGRPPHGFNPAPEVDLSTSPDFEKVSIQQPFDHFDNQNPNTFNQKFYKNGQWAKPGGPNFLMIGGEGPESSRWVLSENLTWLTYAKQFGATVYLLEHRYYGESIVGGDMSNPNPDMKYLSSLQMLYDCANFIRSINYQTGNTAPWITFGGSYSGAMSLWMRQVFPDLVVGAVGSSGPVQAKLDFYEYLEVVTNSILTNSTVCAQNIQSAFTEMQQLSLTGAGRKQLSDLFTLNPAWDVNTPVSQQDLQYFFNSIYGNFQGAVQYSGDNTGAYATGHGISDMCGFMMESRYSALQNVARFNKYMTEFYTGAPFNNTANSYSQMINYLINAGTYSPDDGAARYWTWQTCTEFGYFQSTDQGNGIFGSPTPVNMFTQMCLDVFGPSFSTPAIETSIRKTNWMYGGRDNYKGTNVVIPNGSLDPWHALGKYTSNDPSVVWYLINGTAHCADMYPARTQDVPDLAVVRQLIATNIAKWLNQSPPGTTAASQSTMIPAVTTQAPVGTTAAPSNGTTMMTGTTSVPVPPTTKKTNSAMGVYSGMFTVTATISLLSALF